MTALLIEKGDLPWKVYGSCGSRKEFAVGFPVAGRGILLVLSCAALVLPLFPCNRSCWIGWNLMLLCAEKGRPYL